MSLKNVHDVAVEFRNEEKLFFKNLEVLGFTERGGFIIDSGDWYTCLAISPKTWRKDNPDHFSMTRCDRMTPTTVAIIDDWGNELLITTSPDSIAALVEDCRDNGLPIS